MVCLLQREEQIPTMDQLAVYWSGKYESSSLKFLDHFCHPASVMLYLMDMPQRMNLSPCRQPARAW